MSRYSLTVGLVAMIASSAALAQLAVNNPMDPPHRVRTAGGHVRWVVSNANDCAPLQPEAVYALNAPTRIAGYRCINNTNGK